jgi:hypothetical protein
MVCQSRIRWTVPVLVLVLIAVSVMPFAGSSAAQSGAFISVESVNISPESPVVGEQFVVTPTIKNAESSSSGVRLNEVILRHPSDRSKTVVRHDVGSLGVGGSAPLQFAMTLDRPGQRQLMLTVRGTDQDGNLVSIEYPVYVDVEERDSSVQFSVSSPDAVAGDETSVNVTVVNGDSSPISGVALDVSGDGIRIDEPRRVKGTLEAGEEHTFSYEVTFLQGRQQSLDTTLSFTTVDGHDRTVSESSPVTVDETAVDTQLTAAMERNESETKVRATLTNFGNVPLEDGQIRAEVGGEVVTRSLIRDVAPETDRIVRLDGVDIPEGPVTVISTFNAAGEEYVKETDLTFAPAPEGQIELTGIDTARQSSTITISGEASNIGQSDVGAVVVSGEDTVDITPVPPSKEFFVGSVEASEFSTFEITVETNNNVSSIPVRVEYTVDDERRTRVVSVDVDSGSSVGESGGDQAGPPGEGDQRGPPGAGLRGGSSGPPVTSLLVGLGLAIVGIGAGVVLWRRNGR